jgi:biotin transporter BioY
VTGRLAGGTRSLGRVLLGCALGMVVIHAGGAAQLAVLGGDAAAALRVGFVPFLTGDLLKIGIAAAVILGLGPKLRTLL